MSTISSTAAHSFSPKQRLLDTIAAQTSAGSISASDQTALDGAVDSIDDSLQSGASSSGSSGSARLDPSQMKSRIDDLIGAQVESGNLTSSQADTLKQVFAQGGGHGGHGGHGGGVSGIGGPGGLPPGPPPADDASGSTDDADAGDTTASGSTSGATATSAATGSDDVSSLLSSFIKQLQDVQSSLGSYSATGQTGANRTASAMLVNFQA